MPLEKCWEPSTSVKVKHLAEGSLDWSRARQHADKEGVYFSAFPAAFSYNIYFYTYIILIICWSMRTACATSWAWSYSYQEKIVQHLPRLSFALGPLPEAPPYVVNRNTIVIDSLHRATFIPLPSDWVIQQQWFQSKSHHWSFGIYWWPLRWDTGLDLRLGNHNIFF